MQLIPSRFSISISEESKTLTTEIINADCQIHRRVRSFLASVRCDINTECAKSPGLLWSIVAFLIFAVKRSKNRVCSRIYLLRIRKSVNSFILLKESEEKCKQTNIRVFLTPAISSPITASRERFKKIEKMFYTENKKNCLVQTILLSISFLSQNDPEYWERNLNKKFWKKFLNLNFERILFEREKLEGTNFFRPPVSWVVKRKRPQCFRVFAKNKDLLLGLLSQFYHVFW